MLRLFWRRRELVALAITMAISLGLIVHHFIPEKYEASSLLFMNSNSALDRADNSAFEARDAPERLLAVAQFALTDDVLSRAIEKVGLSKFVHSESRNANPAEENPGRTKGAAAFFGLRAMASPRILKASLALGPTNPTYDDPALLADTIAALRRNLTVKPDAKANVLVITFRNSDPVVAAEFVNALNQALIDKQLELWGPGSAVNFFEQQKQKFDDQVQRAYDSMTAFSLKSATFSVAEQRTEMLKRYNQLKTEIAATQNQLSQKTGERQAVTEQLRKLKPVTQSQFVSGIVNSFGSKDASQTTGSEAAQRAETTPPLLMIKVYQETIVDLFKADAELTGLNLRRQSENEQLHVVEAELRDLAAKASEYERLRAAVTLAQFNAEAYGKRMAEETANQDVSKFHVSTLKIAQAAVAPLKPVSPSLSLTLLASFILGLLLSAMLIARVEFKTIEFWFKMTSPFPNAAPSPRVS